MFDKVSDHEITSEGLTVTLEYFPGGWTLHMKGVGMLVGNFELNP